MYENVAFNQQKAKKIATLCMIIACLVDEGEGIRKKGPDRDCPCSLSPYDLRPRDKAFPHTT